MKKEMIEDKVNGKRGRGRPPRRYEDNVKSWMKTDLATCTRSVENRYVWLEVTRLYVFMMSSQGIKVLKYT